MARSLEERASILVDLLHFEGRVARFVDGRGARFRYPCRGAQSVRDLKTAELLLPRQSHTARLYSRFLLTRQSRLGRPWFQLALSQKVGQ